jgi:hypothetical protein
MILGGRVAGLLACLGLVLTSAGCAPIWSPINAQTPVPYALATIEVKARLPVGWMSSTYAPLAGVWIFTRHGQELEEIQLRRWPKSQVVKGTNRSLRDDMTLKDIAELSLDSRRLDDGVGGLELLAEEPATVGDRDCYRIDYRYRDAIGLARRTIEYGCPVGGWIYRFEYNAPVQYYFEHHLEPFEAMVRTIEFTTAGA